MEDLAAGTPVAFLATTGIAGMHDREKPSDNGNGNISSQRKEKDERIRRLNQFRQGYSVDLFLADFEKYFDNEIDFNLQAIRQRLEAAGVLEKFITRAIERNTHPVTEFVQELFRELGKSGDVQWTGEL